MPSSKSNPITVPLRVKSVSKLSDGECECKCRPPCLGYTVNRTTLSCWLWYDSHKELPSIETGGAFDSTVWTSVIGNDTGPIYTSTGEGDVDCVRALLPSPSPPQLLPLMNLNSTSVMSAASKCWMLS